MIDYLEKVQTIIRDYYVGLLDRLNGKIKKKRPHLTRKKVLFHQDNAPAHRSVKMIVKVDQLRYELLPHQPYSPALATIICFQT